VLLLVMTAANVLSQALALAYLVPPGYADAQFCWATGNAVVVTYGVVYTAVYVFLLEKAAIVRRLRVGRAGFWHGLNCGQRLVWAVSAVFSVVTMPLFVTLYVVDTSVSYNAPLCGGILGPYQTAALGFTVAVSNPLNWFLIYLFVEPLYAHAQSTRDFVPSTSQWLVTTARKNIVLATMGAGAQTFSMVLLLASTLNPPVNGPNDPTVTLAYVAYSFFAVDPAVSGLCCMAMTNIFGKLARDMGKCCCNSARRPPSRRVARPASRGQRVRGAKERIESQPERDPAREAQASQRPGERDEPMLAPSEERAEGLRSSQGRTPVSSRRGVAEPSSEASAGAPPEQPQPSSGSQAMAGSFEPSADSADERARVGLPPPPSMVSQATDSDVVAVV